MAFRIILGRLAEIDINEAIVYIAKDSPTQAIKWAEKLETVLLSLRDDPAKFSLIPEAGRLKIPFRSVLHYSHRIVYRVDESEGNVFIVRVYHGARRPLRKRDVEI